MRGFVLSHLRFLQNRISVFLYNADLVFLQRRKFIFWLAFRTARFWKRRTKRSKHYFLNIFRLKRGKKRGCRASWYKKRRALFLDRLLFKFTKFFWRRSFRKEVKPKNKRIFCAIRRRRFKAEKNRRKQIYRLLRRSRPLLKLCIPRKKLAVSVARRKKARSLKGNRLAVSAVHPKKAQSLKKDQNFSSKLILKERRLAGLLRVGERFFPKINLPFSSGQLFTRFKTPKISSDSRSSNKVGYYKAAPSSSKTSRVFFRKRPMHFLRLPLYFPLLFLKRASNSWNSLIRPQIFPFWSSLRFTSFLRRFFLQRKLRYLARPRYSRKLRSVGRRRFRRFGFRRASRKFKYRRRRKKRFTRLLSRFSLRSAGYRAVIKSLERKNKLNLRLLLENFVFGFFLRALRKHLSLDLSALVGRSDLSVNFFFLFNNLVTPQLLAKHFIANFRSRFLPGEIVKRYFSRLRRRPMRSRAFGNFMRPKNGRLNLRGLMVKCSGRFSRQQRASYKVFKFGSVSLNSVVTPVEYFFATTALKFGAVGVKVFLIR